MKPRARVGNEGGFLDHLEDLRRKMLVAVFWMAAAAVISFIFADRILAFVIQGIRDLNIPLYYIKPQEKVVTYLQAALFFGVFSGIPVLVIQAARFILPGLSGTERRIFIPTVVLSVVFFIGGTLFAWRLLIPFALRFFYQFSQGDGIEPLWSVSESFSLVISLTLAMGFVFQTPWLLQFFILSGIVPVQALKKYRRHALVIIFIIAAALTPTDIFSQFMVGVPLYILYEFSIFYSSILKFLTRPDKKEVPNGQT